MTSGAAKINNDSKSAWYHPDLDTVDFDSSDEHANWLIQQGIVDPIELTLEDLDNDEDQYAEYVFDELQKRNLEAFKKGFVRVIMEPWANSISTQSKPNAINPAMLETLINHYNMPLKTTRLLLDDENFNSLHDGTLSEYIAKNKKGPGSALAHFISTLKY